ncbi:hypothetical protein LENED_001078 [Lentinula edodes]|uniref:Uncharacterized protein n=1 Tax=Lentinula edodes TaxID=5353 RepID=A0A1Q3DXF2_LENED|nr:hypothetical protein LENED_001078 [Lentinula edodes]
MDPMLFNGGELSVGRRLFFSSSSLTSSVPFFYFCFLVELVHYCLSLSSTTSSLIQRLQPQPAAVCSGS